MKENELVLNDGRRILIRERRQWLQPIQAITKKDVKESLQVSKAYQPSKQDNMIETIHEGMIK
jgi:hypothetical protein